MPKPLRVLLVAEEAAGARTLALVREYGHEAVLAVTTPGSVPVAAAAAAAGVPVAAPTVLRDPAFAAEVRAARVDLLLNVHSLVILRAEIVDAPRIGSFNLHPGPLPGYAGRDAPSWAILGGATDYGCTVHWMDAEVDTGPIAYASAFPVEPHETGLSLNSRCARTGLELVRLLLRDAAAGPAEIPATRQPASGRRLFRRGPPADGIVDWRAPAVAIERFVRACDFQPWPSPWAPAPRTWLDGAELRLLRARATDTAADAAPGTIAVDRGIARVCAGDAWLSVEAVAAGGRTMRAAEALAAGGILGGRG